MAFRAAARISDGLMRSVDHAARAATACDRHSSTVPFRKSLSVAKSMVWLSLSTVTNSFSFLGRMIAYELLLVRISYEIERMGGLPTVGVKPPTGGVATALSSEQLLSHLRVGGNYENLPRGRLVDLEQVAVHYVAFDGRAADGLPKMCLAHLHGIAQG